MKYSILLLALIATTANATYKAPEPVSTTTSLSSANSNSRAEGGNATGGNANATGGDTQNSLEFEAKRNPVNSAIAPSVTNFQSCPIVTSDSKAIQAPWFGVSGTTGTSLNPICYALQRNQLEIADKMMCAASKEYKSANPACGE
jgi:hypothetical protein